MRRWLCGWGRAFNQSPQTWLNLQDAYGLSVAEKSIGRKVERIESGYAEAHTLAIRSHGQLFLCHRFCAVSLAPFRYGDDKRLTDDRSRTATALAALRSVNCLVQGACGFTDTLKPLPDWLTALGHRCGSLLTWRLRLASEYWCRASAHSARANTSEPVVAVTWERNRAPLSLEGGSVAGGPNSSIPPPIGRSD